MITKKKVVVKLPKMSKKTKKFFENFEALEVIHTEKEIDIVWKNNKTPVMLSGTFDESKFESIEIDSDLIDINKISEFTKHCYDSGFEPGEYITGRKYNTNDERCFMCEIANYKGLKNARNYNCFIDKLVDCIVYESDNFYVTLELGALKEGFVMIIPKEHYLSMAQCPKELMPEYKEVCKHVEDILLHAFNGESVCFFEHGSSPSGMSSHKKSIVHAHVHVVVDFKLAKKYQDMVQLKPCNDISCANKTHYLSYQEGTDGQLLICKDDKVYIQRQFPRQVLADELEYAPGQYNWRYAEFKEISDKTVYKLYTYLKTLNKGVIYERTKNFVDGIKLRGIF